MSTPPLVFYHDQTQVPQHRYGAGANKPPDYDNGVCTDECDCGTQPCGNYLFDHRNASLADWLINERDRRRRGELLLRRRVGRCTMGGDNLAVTEMSTYFEKDVDLSAR